jgi:hypothetical protein
MSKNGDLLMPFAPYIPGKTTFEKKDFSIEKVAAEQGLKNNPPTTDTEFDEAQTIIKNKSARVHTAERERTADYLSKAKAHLESLKTKILNLSIESLGDNFTVKLKVQRSIVESNLKTLSKNKYEELRHLNFFKKINKIHAIARYPESSIFHFSILLLIVLVETVANSYFFAQGNDLGLLGGYTQALLISVVNVGSSLLLGQYCLRYLIHINIFLKIINFLIFFSYMVFVFIFNLGVGHYRDLRSSDRLVPVTESFQTMLNDPFNLSFDGSMLFFIGIGVAILASFDSYKSDDPYPHYGKMDRAFKEATSKHSKHEESCKHDLEKSAQNALKEINGELQESRSALDKFGEYLIHVKNSYSVFKDSSKRINNEYLEDLKQYRETNKGIRTDPPPEYFSVFEEAFSNNLENQEWVDRFDAVQKDLAKQVKTNESQRDEVKKQISKQLEAELDNLQAVITKIDKGMSKELKEQDQFMAGKDKSN